METKYHSAAHLLNAALKHVIDPDIHQRGANITAERLRFDFNYDNKLTDEQKTDVENLVNKWIDEDYEILSEEMKKEDAKANGVYGLFWEKYPDIVTVYTIGDFSQELCGGPHVDRTGNLGKFKISKEESSSAGVRRIKAILED